MSFRRLAGQTMTRAGRPLGIEIPVNSPYPVNATSLSAEFAVGLPAGGEMSGLTAHFLFGANSGVGKVALTPFKQLI
jgi:hypothetical protein